MEDSFKYLIFAFIMCSLFGMLILTVVVNVGNDYEKDTSEVVGGSLALDKFNDSISSFEQNSQDLKDAFDKGSVWSVLAGVVVEGVFGIAKDMVKMILLPVDVVIDIMNDVFGVPAFVTSIILGLLILAVIFGIWRLIRIGD